MKHHFKYGNGGFSYVQIPLQESCSITHVDPQPCFKVSGVQLNLEDAGFSAYNRRFSMRYPTPLHVSVDSWSDAMELQGKLLENGNRGILIFGSQWYLDDLEFFTVDNEFLQKHPHLYERVLYIDGTHKLGNEE